MRQPVCYRTQTAQVTGWCPRDESNLFASPWSISMALQGVWWVRLDELWRLERATLWPNATLHPIHESHPRTNVSRRKNYRINLQEFGAEDAGTKNYRISPRSGEHFQKLQDFYRNSAKITDFLQDFKKITGLTLPKAAKKSNCFGLGVCFSMKMCTTLPLHLRIQSLWNGGAPHPNLFLWCVLSL